MFKLHFERSASLYCCNTCHDVITSPPIQKFAVLIFVAVNLHVSAKSAKICTMRNFPLYGNLAIKHIKVGALGLETLVTEHVLNWNTIWQEIFTWCKVFVDEPTTAK